jgi:DNA polymerase III subunit alpha
LFGLAAAAKPEEAIAVRAPEQPDWSEAVRLKGERDTLGLYLTGHPIARFEEDLPRFVSHRIGDLISEKPMPTQGFSLGKSVSVAGLIDEIKKRGPRTILNLDDRTGRLEVTLFEEVFQKHRELVAKDALVMVEGKIRFDEFSNSWRLAANRLTELDRLREQQARRLVLSWPASSQSEAQLNRLMEILSRWRGGSCPITIEYCAAGAAGAFTLGQDWNVKPTRELIDQVEGLIGRDGVQIVYGPPPSLAQAAPLG